jgi:hypothetical protein
MSGLSGRWQNVFAALQSVSVTMGARSDLPTLKPGMS